MKSRCVCGRHILHLKGLQNNSGLKLACVYLFLFAASECDHNLNKVNFPSYSSQLSTAADRCKNSSQGRITMELILLYFDLYNQKHCFLPYENITDNKKLRLPQGHFQIPALKNNIMMISLSIDIVYHGKMVKNFFLRASNYYFFA